MSDWQYEYIRDNYGIAIKKGMAVEDLEGKTCKIVGASNHVKVKMDGGKVNYYHPDALKYPEIGYIGKEFSEVTP